MKGTRIFTELVIFAVTYRSERNNVLRKRAQFSFYAPQQNH